MLAVPVEDASVRSVVSRPPPLPVEPPTNAVSTVIVPAPPDCDEVMPVLYPSLPAVSVLLVPGVVEAMVLLAEAELKPVLVQ